MRTIDEIKSLLETEVNEERLSPRDGKLFLDGCLASLATQTDEKPHDAMYAQLVGLVTSKNWSELRAKVVRNEDAVPPLPPLKLAKAAQAPEPVKPPTPVRPVPVEPKKPAHAAIFKKPVAVPTKKRPQAAHASKSKRPHLVRTGR